MHKILVLILVAVPAIASADSVTTAERVDSFVNVRGTPSADGEVVGRLARGEQLPLVEAAADKPDALALVI